VQISDHRHNNKKGLYEEVKYHLRGGVPQITGKFYGTLKTNKNAIQYGSKYNLAA
jgi:hypothetical protein